MIYIVIVSVLLGLVIGYSSPLVIPVAYSKIFSVALVAALDAAFGGLRAVVSFGFRMFKNLAMLRRYLLRDYRSGGHKSMLRNP